MEEWLENIASDLEPAAEVLQALERARQLAARLGHLQLGPIHIFLVLLEDPALQRQSGLSLAAIRESIEERLPDGGISLARLPTKEKTVPGHKQYLLAAFDPGQKGAEMLEALGVDSILFRLNLQQDRSETGGADREFDDVWDYFGWLKIQKTSVGRSLFEKLGVEWERVQSWITQQTLVSKPNDGPDWVFMCLAEHFLGGAVFDSCARLFDYISRYTVISPFYWAQKRQPPSSAEPIPGFKAARYYGHSQIEPIHLFAEALETPSILADYPDVRRACEQRLGSRSDSGTAEQPGYSQEAWKILESVAVSSLLLGNTMSPLHQALKVLEHFDRETTNLVESSEHDSDEVEMQLSRLVWGKLIGGPWKVDDISLGTPAAELGDLTPGPGGRCVTAKGTTVWLDGEQQVTAVQGKTLADSRRRLFGPSSRLQDAERLVGIGRANRWARLPDAFLRLNVDLHGLVSVGMRAVPAHLNQEF